MIDNCYLYLALLDFYDQDYASAENYLNTCLASCQKNGFKREAIWANTFLLTVNMATNKRPKALHAAKEALSLLKTVDTPDDFRLFLDHFIFFAEHDDLSTAVRVFAVAEILEHNLNVLRPAREQQRLDAFEARARKTLGAKEFNRLCKMGKSSSQVETVTFIENFLQTI